MRTRRKLAIFLALVALALPAGAAAKPGYYVVPSTFSVTANLPRSHGYSITVVSLGHRQILVEARKKDQLAFYRARGRANRRRLEVDLGRFGHLRMRFRGSTQRQDVAGCKGRPSVKGSGLYQGWIRFHGRRGFVDVTTHRIRGRFERSFRQVCPNARGNGVVGVGIGRVRGEAGRGTTVDTLEARARAHGRTYFLTALQVESPELPPIILGGAYERVGRVLVTGSVETLGGVDSLTFSKPGADPETATVRPGPPFAGEASYVKRLGFPAEWTGTLRAPVPGFGEVALAGADFHAEACHTALVRFEGCIRPQGSGSHSQPFGDARLSWSR